MAVNRTDRLNSLLKGVISEVIRLQVRNEKVADLFSVTRVDISKDLHHAKVYISVIGTEAERTDTIDALQSAAGFISVTASKKVVMRHFPALRFILDDTVDKQMRVEELLQSINNERTSREMDKDDDAEGNQRAG